MPSRRALLAGTSSLAAAALAGCLDGTSSPVSAGTDADTDWPMPDYDALGTAYAPDAAAPRSSPNERFAVETSSPTDRPVVADGTVYLPTMAGLLAVDATDGTERWRYAPDEDGAHFPRSPAVHDGTVYLTGDSGGLRALDADTGDVRWTVDGEARFTAAPAPTRDWDAVFVGDTNGTVSRVTPDGEIDWRMDVFGTVTRLVADYPAGVTAGTEGGEVYSLYDGRGLWRRQVPGKVTALAGTNGNDVLAGTFGGGVLRLEGGAHAGRPRWRAADGPTAHRSLVIAGDGAFGADGAGLTRLDGHSGDRDWQLGDDYFAAPAGAGDTVYVAGDGEVAAYKLGGGVGSGGTRVAPRRWTYDLGSRGGRHVAIADGAVFVPVEGGDGGTTELIALE